MSALKKRLLTACLSTVGIAVLLGADVANANPIGIEHVDLGIRDSWLAKASGGGERFGGSSAFGPSQVLCEALPDGPGTVCPEPGSLALIGAGLAGLYISRRRKLS